MLRTQTSPVQVREMQRSEPPIHLIAPGAVYRRDDIDATHSPMFHQMEGLAVDEGLTMAHLKGTMLHFFRELLGRDREILLQPHFFPFTEPSVDIQVSYTDKNGRPGWLELHEKDGGYIPAGIPHQYYNISESPATILFGVAPSYCWCGEGAG